MENIRGKRRQKKKVMNLDEKDRHGHWPGNQHQSKTANGKRFLCDIIVR